MNTKIELHKGDLPENLDFGEKSFIAESIKCVPLTFVFIVENSSSKE